MLKSSMVTVLSLFSWTYQSAAVVEENKKRKHSDGVEDGGFKRPRTGPGGPERRLQELKRIKEKLRLERAVRSGTERQASAMQSDDSSVTARLQEALQAEREQLLGRLEEQSRAQQRREAELRDSRARELEGKADRETLMAQFEEKLKAERDKEEQLKQTLVNEMEKKLADEGEKWKREFDDLISQKLSLEEKLRLEKEEMELERAGYLAELEMVKEEKQRQEEEVRSRSAALEQSRAEQERMQTELQARLRESEARKETLEMQIRQAEAVKVRRWSLKQPSLLLTERY